MLTATEFMSLVHGLAPQIACDPRPRSTIRVGAIGHRFLNSTEAEAAKSAVEGVLSNIRTEAIRLLNEPSFQLQFAGGPDFVLITALAEGADRFVAKAAFAQEFLLAAILPFGLAAYEASFDAGEKHLSVAEFRELLDKAALPDGYGIDVLDGEAGPNGRDEAFLECARSIAARSDILIAILSQARWDSHTGIVARESIDAGFPVLLVDLSRDGEAAIRVGETLCGSENLQAQVSSILRSILAPPATGSLSGGPAQERRKVGIAQYCKESVTCRSSIVQCRSGTIYSAKTVAPFWVRWCTGLNRAFEAGIKGLLSFPSAPKSRDDPRDLAGLDFSHQSAHWFAQIVLRYQRADALATAYAELHRSAQIVIVLLGVATIGFGSMNAPSASLQSFLSGAELLSLLFALAFIWKGHRQAWLDRWLDYRLLAEICRYSIFLLLAGRASLFRDASVPIGAAEERTWVRKYGQDLLRAHRLSIPGRGRCPDEHAVGKIKAYLAQSCLGQQIEYHRSTHEFRLKVARWLRNASFGVSLITVGIVALKFAFSFRWTMPPEVVPAAALHALNVCAIALPAITGAILALRAFGEHDVVAKQSAGIAAKLEMERIRMEEARNLKGIGDSALRATRLLLREIDGWLDIFADKQLE